MRSYKSHDDDILGIAAEVNGSGCCSFSTRCCISWVLFSYIIQLVLSAGDTATGIVGLVEFQNHVSMAVLEDELLSQYIHVWRAGYGLTLLVWISNLSLLCYVLHQLCQRNWDYWNGIGGSSKAQRIIRIWTIVNFVLDFLFEDCMVSLARMLLSLESEEAENQLKSRTERIGSIITFTASLLQLLMIVGPMVAHRRNKTSCCTEVLTFDTFCLFTGCVALCTSFLTLLISTSIHDVQQGNTLEYGIALAVAVGVIFLILETVICCCKKGD